MAVYYKALVKKCVLRQTLSIQIKKLKSSFERRLHTFVFFVFFGCILMSLITRSITAYTLWPFITTKWLMCENGMNPRVPLRALLQNI